MVFFEDGTRRLFRGEDPATLTSLVQLMPDICYDYALKKLRATAHEVEWLGSCKKDLVWDNCDDMLAAGMTISETLRTDCARTLGVFMKVMFQFKTKKYGPHMQHEDSEDSLGGFELSSGTCDNQDAKDDETDARNSRSPRPGGTHIEGADEDEPNTSS